MATEEQATRVELDLSRGWSFTAGRKGWRSVRPAPEAGDRAVSLPHSWNRVDTFQPGVVYRRGYGSYLKTFDFPSEPDAVRNRVWFLESEGFYGIAAIRLNGRRIGTVDGQYLGFSLDLSGLLRPGASNTLGIRLSNDCPSHVLPGIKAPDFLLYGGLSGRLRLRGVPDLHVESDGTRIACDGVMTAGTSVTIDFAVRNSSRRPRRCVALWTVLEATGQCAGEAASVPFDLAAGARSEATVRIPVRQPALWSPETPALYRARCRLMEEGHVRDAVSERFGIREAVFRPGEGFFLNGRRVPIRGCNRHECMPGFGSALPDRQHREDAAVLKRLGLNAVRLSHYPQHPLFLDACDELGLLVYAEIATWKSVRGGRWLRSACRQMEAMIRRDRNRPSVIVWGMGNESRSRRAYLKLRGLARRLDPSRPVTYAENHLYRARRERTLGLPDIWSCNYETDALDEGIRGCALKTAIVSECCNTPDAVRGDLEAESRQAVAIEEQLDRLEARRDVAGFLLWCLNDYATMRKKRFRRYSGIVDAWRRPKMAASLLRARYTEAPFVKVFGAWERGTEAGTRVVHIITNCEAATVRRNGVTVDTLGGPGYWKRSIEYEAGELEVLARRGEETVSDRLVTPGPAAAIGVISEAAAVEAGNGAAAGFVVSVLDARNEVVGSWSGHLGVEVRGPAVVRSYRPDGAVAIAGGTGRGFVVPTGAVGEVIIRVSGSGLAPVEARLECG